MEPIIEIGKVPIYFAKSSPGCFQSDGSVCTCNKQICHDQKSFDDYWSSFGFIRNGERCVTAVVFLVNINTGDSHSTNIA